MSRVLVGRQHECDRLESLLEHARSGTARAILLRGEPGSGKTALLGHAVERAAGMRVLRCVGIEAEAELEFSALLDLCRPLIGELDRIGELHRRTLSAAIGLTPGGTSGDRFSTGLALLELLTTCAEDGPILVTCDDVQWLDRSSLDAILFAVRRLDADAVATILVSRPEGRAVELPQLETLEVDELRPEAAVELLARLDKGRVARDVALRLARVTGGNPLALTELAGLLTPEQRSGAHRLDDGDVPGTSVEVAFVPQLEALGPDGEKALLVAALSLRPEIGPVVRALELHGIGAAALDPAEDCGLIAMERGRVTFRHPLVRSATIRRAPPSARRDAHAALASAFAELDDPEPRAWHLAAATVAPDEAVAADLAAVGMAAAARNGFAGAAASLERAAELTPEPALRAHRLLEAAEAAWRAGNTERALLLLREPLRHAADPAHRASALRLQGALEYLSGHVVAAASSFSLAADVLLGSDPEAAVGVGADAVNALMPAADPAAALALAERVMERAKDSGAANIATAEIALGYALCLGGRRREGRALLERGLGVPGVARDGDLLAAARVSWSLAWLGREAEAEAALSRAVGRARDNRAVGLLPYVLATSAWHGIRVGRWRSARADVLEALDLAIEIRQPIAEVQARAVLVWLDALRGDEASCLAQASTVADEAGRLRLELYELLADLAGECCGSVRGTCRVPWTCSSGRSSAFSGR